MSKRRAETDGACVVAIHPMVAAELARLLGKSHRPVAAARMSLGADTEAFCATLPRCRVYAIDACVSLHHDLALVRAIRERMPSASVLVLSETFGAANAIPFLRLGVKGLLSYRDAPRRFREAVDQVARGKLWASREVVSVFVDSLVTPARHPVSSYLGELSRREQEVLRALLDNLSNKEIGSRLHISERTAKFHVGNLLRKVGVKRRSDLIARWWQGESKAS
ncbi:MAG: response regulator transcription factor [Acidobacteriota bacterium]